MKTTKHDYGAKYTQNCCLIGTKGNVRRTTFICTCYGTKLKKIFQNIYKYLKILQGTFLGPS